VSLTDEHGKEPAAGGGRPNGAGTVTSAEGSGAGAGGARPGGAGTATGPGGPAAGAGGERSGSGAGADPRVAEVLQQLRSGVRLRRAEAAVAAGLGDLAAGGGEAPGSGGELPGGGGVGFAQGLLAVRSAEYLQEPDAFSHRPRFGKLIVGSRKAFFHLFLKWFLRPLIAQQNAFNQAAGRLVQELAEASQRQARDTRLLAARVAELEARVAASTAAAAVAARTAAPASGEGLPAPEGQAPAAGLAVPEGPPAPEGQPAPGSQAAPGSQPPPPAGGEGPPRR
jgi:hypothetical protein